MKGAADMAAEDRDEVLDKEDEQQPEEQQIEGQPAEGQHSEDDGHPEIPEGTSDEDREAIRASRREERRAKRDRAREREQTYIRQISSLSQQNQDMASRLANLERRQVGVDFARVDGAINEAAQASEYWKQQIAVAAARGVDGAVDLANAQEQFYVTRRKAEDLARVKQVAATRAQTPQPMDTRVVQAAQGWAERNKWYDLQGRDPDSRVVLALDEQLAAENFDPRTQEYWQELDDRVRKYLPHRYRKHAGAGQRYNSAQDDAGGSPVAGSEREVSGSQSGRGYVLSPARVAALKEAGMYDDPKMRAKMIARYQEADKQQRRGE